VCCRTNDLKAFEYPFAWRRQDALPSIRKVGDPYRKENVMEKEQAIIGTLSEKRRKILHTGAHHVGQYFKTDIQCQRLGLGSAAMKNRNAPLSMIRIVTATFALAAVLVLGACGKNHPDSDRHQRHRHHTSRTRGTSGRMHPGQCPFPVHRFEYVRRFLYGRHRCHQPADLNPGFLHQSLWHDKRRDESLCCRLRQ